MSDTWHSMRVSNADRDRAADLIKAATAEGRLSWDEHGRRIEQAMHAQTYAELQQVTADLPTGIHPTQQGHAPQQLVPASPWQPNPPVPRKTNDMAVASLVCGGLSFMVGVTAIPAIITGHMALSRLKHSNEDGRGLAITGLILGYTVTAGAVLLVAMIMLMVVVAG